MLIVGAEASLEVVKGREYYLTGPHRVVLLAGQIRNVVFKQPLQLPHAECGGMRWKEKVGDHTSHFLELLEEGQPAP